MTYSINKVMPMLSNPSKKKKKTSTHAHTVLCEIITHLTWMNQTDRPQHASSLVSSVGAAKCVL